MDTRTLGRTGLQVSRLTFGCGAVGGLMTKGRPEDQLRAVERALDLGVNFIDTAALYGNGASETNVGRILKQLKPDIVLGTKVRVAPHDKHDIGNAITRSLEQSLSRLQRDHVDLLQLHNTLSLDGQEWNLSPEIVLEDVVPVFERLRRDGKIRFFGMTAIGETPALRKVIDAGTFDTAQIVYNLLNPSAGDPVAKDFSGQNYDGLLARATAAGMGTIAIRVLAGGALSGQMTRHPLGMQNVAPIGSGKDYGSDVERARHMAAALSPSAGKDIVETAIRYVVSHPDVTTLQVGMATVEQFEGAASAVNKGPLEASVLGTISEMQSGDA